MTLLVLALACGGCGRQLPEGFDRLAGDLRDFEGLDATLSWADPELPARNRGSLRITPDPRAALDVRELQTRLAWDGQVVRVNTELGSLPVPSLQPYAEELWGEVRTGFAGSRWKAADPPAGLTRLASADEHWATVSLPFDWARDLTLWLGVDQAGAWTDLVIETRQPRLEVQVQTVRGGKVVPLARGSRLHVRIEEIFYRARLGDEALDPKGYPRPGGPAD